MADIIADVMSATLFALLLMFSITLAAFMIDLAATNTLDFEFLGTFSSIIVILIQLIIYCHLSENVTNDLAQTGDVFYESQWFPLPVKLQKVYILPILRSQKDFRVTGLGIIECSLRVFASVRLTLLRCEKFWFNIFFFFILQIIRTASSYFILMHGSK